MPNVTEAGTFLSALGSSNSAKSYVYTDLGVRRRSEVGCHRDWLALDVRASDALGTAVNAVHLALM